jgi:16S rRNA (guanine527-N7)-methyltransferase
MNVSRETEDLLRGYADLIRKWNPSINLVAPATLPDLEFRHITDSAQIYDLAQPSQGSWLDIGSGGGLPGIVLAIQSRHTPLQVTLVESDKRKSAFLATARRELNLPNLTIKPQRIEALAEGQYDFISARALAALDKLMPDLYRQLASHGEAWLLKGRSWDAEVADARKQWRFELETFQSKTDPQAAILKLRKIKPND